jgi:hypothetical protein
MNTIHAANLSVLFVPAKFLYDFLRKIKLSYLINLTHRNHSNYVKRVFHCLLICNNMHQMPNKSHLNHKNSFYEQHIQNIQKNATKK